MMRALAVMLALGLGLGPTGGALADMARVMSGEHADFTRLVVELPEASAWRVGRTAMGYAFAVEGAAQPSYDLARVWQRIPRTRLQALRVDPDSGALALTLACPCHVMPFEYRPGMIVLDIRNGPPPPGSAFEAPFAATGSPPQDRAPRAGTMPDTYDWRTAAPGPDAARAPLPLPADAVSLVPLRDALLAQISRGAVDGVVDMVLPGKPSLAVTPGSDAPPGARIGLGALPGIDLKTGPAEVAAGDACLPETELAVGDWGGGRAALDILADARNGLYGEFDAVVPDAVIRSMRQHLYLGFGAEALQYAGLLAEGDRPPGLATLLSIARLIEGQADPGTPFADMLHCDGAAALWAALAHADLPTAAAVNADAIVRGFAALPPHLRRHLGPRLAQLLGPRDDTAARMIRDAMARTPGVDPAAVALVDTGAELAAGRADLALQHVEAALPVGDPDTLALIALVEAHFQALTPLAPDHADSLTARQREVGQGPNAPAFRRALVLAMALSGQPLQAQAAAGQDRGLQPDLWRVLVPMADDSSFLTLAVSAAAEGPPRLPPDLARALARRLLTLGFPDQALAWLGPVSTTDDPAARLLAAEAELARDAARQALTLLAGLEGAEALELRAKAGIRLGARQETAQAATGAGQADDAAHLAAWQANWAALAETEAAPWGEAAAFAAASPPSDDGPLTRGAALLETSAAARAAVQALLAATDVPVP